MPYRPDLPLQQLARARVGAVNEGAGYLRLLAVPDGALQALPGEQRGAVGLISDSTGTPALRWQGLIPGPFLPIPLSTPPPLPSGLGRWHPCPGDGRNLLGGCSELSSPAWAQLPCPITPTIPQLPDLFRQTAFQPLLQHDFLRACQPCPAPPPQPEQDSQPSHLHVASYMNRLPMGT